MKTPVALVAAALTIAILIAASFLIATKTHGEKTYGDNALWLTNRRACHGITTICEK